MRHLKKQNLKTILIFNDSKKNKAHIQELKELAGSAGIQVLGTLHQRQNRIHHSTYFGSGKIHELQDMILETEANLIIFNGRLTGVQARNLNNILKISIWERNQLILKIFADRARSYEGQLQVSLAQKLDELTRVRGAWLGSLSRQGGGLGARGPGEKALETDRRQIQKRIRFLRKKLQTLRKNRSQQRKLRQSNQICSFALIGYTNSGKSTLLNRLSRAKVETQNQLFLTLDPTTRKVFVPGLNPSVLTDTVGFIKDLPPHLIEAFKATLEESACADVLLHVIDTSNPNMTEQIAIVNSLIREFGWNKKPIIHVYNKIDQVCKTFQRPSTAFYAKVSALSGQGTSHLLKEMKRAYLSLNKKVELFFPHSDAPIMHSLKQQMKIHKIEQAQGGTLIQTGMPDYQINSLKNFITK